MKTQYTMNKLLWISFAFLAGAFLPIQAALNTKLGKAAESPIHASMLSFIVGAFGLITYIFITRQDVSWSSLKEAPVYAWMGGLLGAFYVTVIIFAFSKLGPGLTFGLVVAGQMIVSILMEHFNILVAQRNPISFAKVLGIVLVIAGVVLLRK